MGFIGLGQMGKWMAVNGQAIHFLLGMQTPLKEDDIVLILPLISGG